MTVGDRIREKREKLSMAQTDLAIKVGISKQTLYKYENNIVTNIPLSKITDIAKVLNVSEAYLMGWEKEISFKKLEIDDSYSEEEESLDENLVNMNKRMKEYALKLADLSSENQELIMQMIDKLTDKKGE